MGVTPVLDTDLELGTCERCGSVAHTRPVTFRQNVGLVLGRATSTVSGELCQACATTEFLRTTGITAVAGWWSLSSLVVGPLCLVANTASYFGAGTFDPYIPGERLAARRPTLGAVVRAEAPPPEPDPDRGGARALLATATFFGEVVEETFTPYGRVLQIGNSDAMAVPVPQGWPYLARVRWLGDTARVTDGEGTEHTLAYGGKVEIEAGPVALTLQQVPRYMLRRTGETQVWGSLAWFTVVYAFTLMTMSGGLAYQMRCELLPPAAVATLFPECFASGADSGLVSGRYTAEYLARLLREDYAGADDGAIEPEDRETGERDNPSFYLPAGSTGPITDMGGADETASEEIRAPEQAAEDDEVHEAEVPLVAPEGTGVPIPATPEMSDDDAVAEAEDGEDDSTTRPAEDRHGWGVQDWYDATDETMEDLEIEYMLRHARDRLRIDPDDPDALSILSYYQYLAQDYDAARVTYDKYISLYPDESAGYNNKALIYKRRGDYEKEEGLYRVALALRPNDETALNNLAVCLAHQGRHDEALSIMERLETLDPDDPYADLHRSKIYAEMGEDDQAFAYLEKALQGMAELDTLHHIEFRQDIRIDPSFEKLRHSRRFHAILERYYGDDSPLLE